MGNGSHLPNSVTAILLDNLNTDWSNQATAQAQVIKFLKQIQPDDRIGLFSLGPSLRVLHDFTTDSRDLVGILNKHGGNIASELGASQGKTMDALKAETGITDEEGLAMMARVSQLEAQFMTESRVERTLKAIEAIAEHLAGVPGRKNLIWVSGSFPAWARFDWDERGESPRREWRSFGSELSRTVRALNQANVAVYPVDARGLMTDPGFAAEQSISPSTGWTPPNIDTMKELASGTGGLAFYNTNDIQGSIRRAIEDSRITYTLGYYPSDDSTDGKYRTIKVKVNRPGLTVRHRRGYTGAKVETTLSDKTADVELRQALWSPVDSTAIAMNARVDRVKGSDLLHVVVQIAPDSVTMDQSDGVRKVNLAFALIQNDSVGRQVSGLRDEITVNVGINEYSAILRTGILFRKQVPMPATAASLKIAVVDRPTGITGSITVPLSRVVEHDPRVTQSPPR
jgi:VWFA-related protein